jgi:hypothetical protein
VCYWGKGLAGGRFLRLRRITVLLTAFGVAPRPRFAAGFNSPQENNETVHISIGLIWPISWLPRGAIRHFVPVASTTTKLTFARLWFVKSCVDSFLINPLENQEKLRKPKGFRSFSWLPSHELDITPFITVAEDFKTLKVLYNNLIDVRSF